MGKVYLSEFKQKLAKKFKNNELSKVNTPVNIQELQNKKNRRFYTSLSDHLTNNEIRKSIKKVNNHTIKFVSQPQINLRGASCAHSISLSLNEKFVLYFFARFSSNKKPMLWLLLDYSGLLKSSHQK